MGKKIGEMLDKVKRDGKYEPLRRYLKHIYGTDEKLNELDRSRPHGAQRKPAQRRSHATPVFDGAKEPDIVDMLQQAGLAKAASRRCSTAYRRGVPAQSHGRLHLHAELHHLVDDKIHARSIGPTARHPAAAGRQGAVRRSALRRNGSVGLGSLRRRLHVCRKS